MRYLVEELRHQSKDNKYLSQLQANADINFIRFLKFFQMFINGF